MGLGDRILYAILVVAGFLALLELVSVTGYWMDHGEQRMGDVEFAEPSLWLWKKWGIAK